MKRMLIGIMLAALLAGAAPAAAQTDTTFTYQGELNENGSPANGSYAMDFSLWDAVSGGVQLGSTVSMVAVGVADGRFSVNLDFGANVFDNSARWLEIAVNGQPLSPRQPITRVPYAIQTRGLFVNSQQYVGIGTTSPTSPLSVKVTNTDQAVSIQSTNPSNNFTALGVTHSGSGPAILAWNSGTGRAGDFRVFSPNAAAALRGLNQGVGNAGLFEISNSANDAPAIHAETNGAAGTAVFGLATAGSGLTSYGGRFESDTPGGVGVLGMSNASSGGGAGVRGVSSSNTEGKAMYGIATATSGNTFGGYFQSSSTNGNGVFGWASNTSGGADGVVGQSNADGGRGVYGQATSSRGYTIGVEGLSQSDDGKGVEGIATSPTGLTYGVYGAANSPDGYDFYAAGAGVNYGSESSIRWKHNVVPIDHPLDKVAKLRGVYYDWDAAHGGQHDVGMIAEEVGAVLPEIVSYEANGIDASGMDYSKIAPLLVEAIKAQQAQIDDLKAQVELLQSMLAQQRGDTK